MTEDTKVKKPVKRFYRKRVELFRLIDKIKLWPSRTGILHGIKTIEKMGDQAQIPLAQKQMVQGSLWNLQSTRMEA
jgi:hypothetical protein